MVHQIAAAFPKHQRVKMPVCYNLPVIGAVKLPVWLDYQLAFITPKGNHKTLTQMAQKLVKKASKLKNK